MACWAVVAPESVGVCAIGGDLSSFDVHVLGPLLSGVTENLYADGSVFVECAIRYPGQ